MTEHMQLTEGEKKVLAGLLESSDRIEAKTLAGKLGEKEHRVVSILNVLFGKSLIKLESKESTAFSLTDEGKRYADHGLPEVRLFMAVKALGGSAELDEAVARSGIEPATKGIALNWGRRNGWLNIAKSDGKTILETKGEEATSTLTDVLAVLRTGQTTLPQHLSEGLSQAKERTLVEASTSKVFEAHIPKEMRAAASSLLQTDSSGIGDLTSEIIASGSWREKAFRPYNVEAVPPLVNYGRKHPYAEFNDWLREILLGLGFSEWYGPYVETEFWNNDTLFVPQDHVARELQDQFRIVSPFDHGDIADEPYYRRVKAVHENGGGTGSIGWQSTFSRETATRLCLRAHTTPVSMRYLHAHRESPQKMFILDRNFRSEALNATHAHEFDQCEGIIMDKGLTLRDLMGYLTEICKRVGITKIKFKPGQFPFTEPSVETYAKHDVLGWIEVAPGGMFRPEVTYPHGIHDPVLAWGIGSGRLYMAAMGINDIRDLFSRDLNWIRRQYFVR